MKALSYDNIRYGIASTAATAQRVDLEGRRMTECCQESGTAWRSEHGW